MLISGGAALLNLGLTQLNAPVVAHASESSNVSTWDGTTLAEPTQSVIMGGQTFYVVRTASQLAYLRSTGSLSNNYILVNDIDLASHDWSPICVSKAASDSSQSKTSSFNGVLDGNGHTIKISNWPAPLLSMSITTLVATFRRIPTKPPWSVSSVKLALMELLRI